MQNSWPKRTNMFELMNTVSMVLFVVMILCMFLLLGIAIAEHVDRYDIANGCKDFALVILIIGALILCFIVSNYKEEQKDKGTKYQVTYEYVNVRKEPGTGEVWYTLDKGDIVELTGKKVTFDGMADPYRRYVEITRGGWVTISALERIDDDEG